MADDYCRRKADPTTFLGGICGGLDGCGHALAVHIGTDHCPVCELVDLAKQRQDEISPEEKVRRGIWSLNRYRQHIGDQIPPAADIRLCLVNDANRGPQIGAVVHCIRRNGSGCWPGSVEAIRADNAVDVLIPPHCTERMRLERLTYDETGTGPHTWHWPCNRAKTNTPEQEPDQPITVNITVSGSVLHDAIEQQMRRLLRSDPDWQRYARC
jgi:hypothetical protein